MDQSLRKKEDSLVEPVAQLQREIAALEAELERLKQETEAFESEIHSRLNRQIARVRELSELYKKRKKEKKAKRLEQKKRGKNYKEPKQLQPNREPKEAEAALNDDEQQALKRLYREAVVQVHPDKVSQAGDEDRILHATSITARLNDIYKRGDLDELINFYQTIISGSQVPGLNTAAEERVDPKIRLASLKRKKEAVMMQLEQVRNSYSYTVLQTYENPLSFIDELRLQFEERIIQLEKRTRKR